MPRGINTYDEHFIQGRLDPDAARYISAIERLENQALENGVKMAVLNFVVGCKSVQIWDAIKACCILAGARTLNGALIPLKGPAPTNSNFVGSDYNRRTGLAGNGSTKYLSTNRNNNADPQDNNHNAVWVSSPHAAYVGVGQYLGSGQGDLGRNNLAHNTSVTPNDSFGRSRTATAAVSGTTALGFFGHTRLVSADFVMRVNGVNITTAAASVTPENAIVDVFRRGTGSYTDARLAFYSVGEALPLGAYDVFVSHLITQIGRALP